MLYGRVGGAGGVDIWGWVTGLIDAVCCLIDINIEEMNIFVGIVNGCGYGGDCMIIWLYFILDNKILR